MTFSGYLPGHSIRAAPRSGPHAAQREAIASGDEMLVGAAKEVTAGAADHPCCRILTAVRQSRIGRAALLGLVQSGYADVGLTVARMPSGRLCRVEFGCAAFPLPSVKSVAGVLGIITLDLGGLGPVGWMMPATASLHGVVHAIGHGGPKTPAT